MGVLGDVLFYFLCSMFCGLLVAVGTVVQSCVSVELASQVGVCSGSAVKINCDVVCDVPKAKPTE